MDSEMEAIIAEFFTEADELLDGMEESIVALETAPTDADLIKKIFRGAHTIKGNAASLAFDATSRFANVVEDALSAVRDHSLAVTQGLISTLLESVDVLRDMLGAAGRGHDVLQPEQQTLLARLEAFTRGSPLLEVAILPQAEWQDYRVAGHAVGDTTRTVRIDIEKLDRLLNLTGELTIFRGRLEQKIELARPVTGNTLLETHREADRLYMDLQEQVMKLRMVPVGPSFRHFTRTVRDIATSHGKLARLTLDGGDVEVDTRVMELLKDPLLHMIRNSVDHGVESPSERQAAGKDPCGTIHLRTAHEAGMVVIELSDDGTGLKREGILRRARELGSVAGSGMLSDEEVYSFIFEAGFSTSAGVTDLSGRGVGLDVVKRNVELLRGQVSVMSRPGQGTTFTIRLPLTMAIIEGFRVGVGDETYVIPLDTVIECMELPQEEVPHEDGCGVLHVRGEPLPYVRLRGLFDLPAANLRRENVVIVQFQNLRAGLVVDTLFGESQVVVKALGKMFQNIPGISGSSVLGNGRIALILDIAALIEKAVRNARHRGMLAA